MQSETLLNYIAANDNLEIDLLDWDMVLDEEGRVHFVVQVSYINRTFTTVYANSNLSCPTTWKTSSHHQKNHTFADVRENRLRVVHAFCPIESPELSCLASTTYFSTFRLFREDEVTSIDRFVPLPSSFDERSVMLNKLNERFPYVLLSNDKIQEVNDKFISYNYIGEWSILLDSRNREVLVLLSNETDLIGLALSACET